MLIPSHVVRDFCIVQRALDLRADLEQPERVIFKSDVTFNVFPLMIAFCQGF